MKLTEDRPYTNPEAAARKLLDIIRSSIADSGLAYAYTGATNTTFLAACGSAPEWSAGRDYAVAQKWIEIDRSRTRVKLLADGSE
jgi:hypothetical protein